MNKRKVGKGYITHTEFSLTSNKTKSILEIVDSSEEENEWNTSDGDSFSSIAELPGSSPRSPIEMNNKTNQLRKPVQNVIIIEEDEIQSNGRRNSTPKNGMERDKMMRSSKDAPFNLFDSDGEIPLDESSGGEKEIVNKESKKTAKVAPSSTIVRGTNYSFDDSLGVDTEEMNSRKEEDDHYVREGNAFFKRFNEKMKTLLAAKPVRSIKILKEMRSKMTEFRRTSEEIVEEVQFEEEPEILPEIVVDVTSKPKISFNEDHQTYDCDSFEDFPSIGEATNDQIQFEEEMGVPKITIDVPSKRKISFSEDYQIHEYDDYCTDFPSMDLDDAPILCDPVNESNPVPSPSSIPRKKKKINRSSDYISDWIDEYNDSLESKLGLSVIKFRSDTYISVWGDVNVWQHVCKWLTCMDVHSLSQVCYNLREVIRNKMDNFWDIRTWHLKLENYDCWESFSAREWWLKSLQESRKRAISIRKSMEKLRDTINETSRSVMKGCTFCLPKQEILDILRRDKLELVERGSWKYEWSEEFREFARYIPYLHNINNLLFLWFGRNSDDKDLIKLDEIWDCAIGPENTAVDSIVSVIMVLNDYEPASAWALVVDEMEENFGKVAYLTDNGSTIVGYKPLEEWVEELVLGLRFIHQEMEMLKEEMVCSQCDVTETTIWRKHHKTNELLCNPCNTEIFESLQQQNKPQQKPRKCLRRGK